jgi:hypothetical protein
MDQGFYNYPFILPAKSLPVPGEYISRPYTDDFSRIVISSGNSDIERITPIGELYLTIQRQQWKN